MSLSRLVVFSLVGYCFLCTFARDSNAFEIAGTASFGVFQVGATTRFAVAPGFALRFGDADGVNLALQDNLVLFPGPGAFGFNNQASVGVGRSWKSFDFDVAASLSAYWMGACGNTLCGRVVGVAPGARVRFSYFPVESSEWLGATLTGDVGWYGGSSLVLPGGPAVTIVAGPVIRWKK
jgi:hypothetical protein